MGKIGPNTETLILAKVGLAKVGQKHKNTNSGQNCPKSVWPKSVQAHCWPKSVKELAKVGLAKVGHNPKELHAQRFNAKEESTPVKGETVIFTVADGTVKISGRDRYLRRSTLIRERPGRGEEQGSSGQPRQRRRTK